MHLFACNQCGYHQETPLPFEVTQRLDEYNDDGAQLELTVDLCGVPCLSDFAMGLQLEFPEPPT